jgi:predicted TIM-barrel enzyme
VVAFENCLKDNNLTLDEFHDFARDAKEVGNAHVHVYEDVTVEEAIAIAKGAVEERHHKTLEKFVQAISKNKPPEARLLETRDFTDKRLKAARSQ